MYKLLHQLALCSLYNPKIVRVRDFQKLVVGTREACNLEVLPLMQLCSAIAKFDDFQKESHQCLPAVVV